MVCGGCWSSAATSRNYGESDSATARLQAGNQIHFLLVGQQIVRKGNYWYAKHKFKFISKLSFDFLNVCPISIAQMCWSLRMYSDDLDKSCLG